MGRPEVNQPMLWHDDVYEALGTDVQASGGNKVVGSILWAEKSPDKAGEHLANCLNRHRAEKLDAEQIIFIIAESRKHNSFATIWFIADQANFTKPEPIEPEDQKAKLQREYIEAAKSMQKIAAGIERLSGG